ncbi:MAG: ATP-binding protein [Erysipelotrichaceae bacterium]|nr:ATP-binding protein [Erysipelotrichaceae bacterium]
MNEFELIKNDPHLSGICDDDACIRQHLPQFLRVYDSRKLCKDCPGLFACRQKNKGQRLDLRYEGVLIEEVEYCRYASLVRSGKAVLEKYSYCDVPENLADIDLESITYTPQQKQLYLQLAALLYEKSDKGLYICGDLGTGKTYLCTALANSLVKRGKRVAFVKVSNFFNEMKSFFGSDTDMIDRNINKLKKADYLFLDDIGSEAVSEFVRDDILFRVLDYRLENKKITLFTSNLSKEELLKHYQYDRKEKSNLMNARRLMERIDILTNDYVLTGNNMRRETKC